MRAKKSEQLSLLEISQPAKVLCKTYAERDAWFARADKFTKINGKWEAGPRGEFWIRSWTEKADRSWELQLVWPRRKS